MSITYDASVISSDRLQLITLTPDVLRLSLSGDTASVERLLGVSIPMEWYQKRDLLALRLEQITKDPDYLPWSVRGMTLQAEGVMVGHIGFHTKPDPPYLEPYAPGGVEYGFVVFPSYRRKGYGREACNAMMRWAYDRHNVADFILTIRPDNRPSLRLAESLGFEKVGFHMDEQDGLEDIFRLTYRPDDAA
jgi:RimJ/RimL family protein N-acetyltransferase